MKGWEYQPHGGPYSLEELRTRYPELVDGLIEQRRRCIASPIYLCDKVLSELWPVNLFDRPSSAHREVEAAMIAQKDTLYVDARGTAKTTFSIEGRSVWQLLKYPNDSGLLTHSSATNAKGLSAAVRAHFTRNTRLRGLFPEYAMEAGDEGNILKWSVPVRTIGGQQESIECATPGTATAGRHYDWICASDWMNEQTTPLYGLGSLEVMKSLVALFSQVRAMLQKPEVNPRAYYAIDSNRWNLADLAGTIIDNDTANVVIKVLRGVTGEPGNFCSSWPEVQTPEDIQRIYDDPVMTDAAFAANYRGVPLAEGGIAFLREWFHDYDEQPSLDVGITMDPAFSDSKTGKKKTDRSGIVVSGIDAEGQLYLLDEAAGRWDETECVNQLIRLLDFWKPTWGVGIEDTGGSRAIISIFQTLCRKTGRFINYREIAPGGRAKEARIAPLHFAAKRWGVRVKKGHCPQTIDELVNYGVAPYDDLADAFAYRVMDYYAPQLRQAVEKPLLTFVPPPKPYTAADFLREMAEHKRRRLGSSWARRTA